MLTSGNRLSIEHIDLFPTRIWQTRLPGLNHLLPTWVNTANAMRAASPKPAGRSNRKGWNSIDKMILSDSLFDELHLAVRACCRHSLKEMVGQTPQFVLESWINIHDLGGFNVLHMHDNVLLSGVFYLQVPPNSGKLVFRDPRPGVLNSAVKGKGPNAHSDIQVTPEGGLVVLFPHWLEHHVEPHENQIPRISISFNAIAEATTPPSLIERQSPHFSIRFQPPKNQ